MTAVAFAIPGRIDLPTGGYAYDRRVLALLPEHGVTVAHLALPGSFPAPEPADLTKTARLLNATPPGTVLLIDGLAYGAMPSALIETVARPIVALVHHPLCLEAGLTQSRQDELRRRETNALALARRVIVTSTATARILAADFAVRAERITVAEPGTDPAPRAAGSGKAVVSETGKRGPVRLLAVGSVIPRKGYDLLIDALAPLVSLPWHLDIAGGLDMSPETTLALRGQIAERGLVHRVTLLGAVDTAHLDRLYHQADLFVMSSHYEGYGMVLTEALARGLPIVCTLFGAAAETIPEDAALKCQAGDVRTLMWTLGRMIEDAGLRARYAEGAWRAAQSLPRWSETARTIAAVIQEVRS